MVMAIFRLFKSPEKEKLCIKIRKMIIFEANIFGFFLYLMLVHVYGPKYLMSKFKADLVVNLFST